MNWRTPAILLLVVVALAALVWVTREDSAEDVSALPTSTPPPVAVRPTDVPLRLFDDATTTTVRRLELQSAGGLTTTLFVQDAEGGWQQSSPLAQDVDDGALLNFLTGLLNLTSRRTLAPDLNPLSSYGLADPWLTVAVSYERDGAIVRKTLFVGSELATSDGYYVQRAGDRRIYVVATSTLNNLTRLQTDPPLPEPTPVPEGG